MELFSEELLAVLRVFADGVINPSQLREYLADRFFSNAPESPFDRLLIGELEALLAEFERGDRNLPYLREKALEFSNTAILLSEHGHEAVLALA